MDLHTLGSIASITSLLISIFLINKVIEIKKLVNKKQKQKIKGDRNITSGRDSKVKK